MIKKEHPQNPNPNKGKDSSKNSTVTLHDHSVKRSKTTPRNTPNPKPPKRPKG